MKKKSKPVSAKRKQKKVPAKPGRKKTIIDFEAVEKYAARGLNKEEIIQQLGVCRDVFYKIQRADDEIEKAIKRGRTKFKVFLTDILVQQAQRGNAASAIWLDKTRNGMREGIGSDDGQDETPVKVIIEVENANNNESESTTSTFSQSTT